MRFTNKLNLVSGVVFRNSLLHILLDILSRDTFYQHQRKFTTEGI